MKICLVISTLQCGGSEKVATLLANNWANTGNSVDVVVLADTNQKPFFNLDQRVGYHPLSLLRPSSSFLTALIQNMQRVWRIRQKVLQLKPDVLISFMDSTNICCLLASPGIKAPVIVCEVALPDLQSKHYLWDRLHRRLIGRADALVAPSRTLSEWFLQRGYSRAVAIPNPVYSVGASSTVKSNHKPDSAFKVIAMGRLSSEKGFDLLLQAFAQVRQQSPNVQLEIFGEGESRQMLEALAEKLNIQTEVRFSGLTSDPHTALEQADIFVLSSRYEGFGNVLVEAMSAGLPVVSFDCPGGPAEILASGTNGLLVKNGDVDALAQAILKLIGNPLICKELSERGREVARSYSIEHVDSLWQELFKSLKLT